MKIKNLILTFLVVAVLGSLNAQNWVGIHSDQPTAAETTLVSSSASGSVVSFTLEGFNLNTVSTPRGDAFVVSVPGATPLLEKGMPDLPKLTASLVIPDQANMKVRVISSEYIDYPFMDVAPSKGNFTRDINPADVAYEYSRAYSRNEFYPSTQASLREPYILRDYRGQTVVVSPFAYNPVTRILRVYHHLTVEVVSDGNSTDNVLVRTSIPEKTETEYAKIYKRHFLNMQDGSRYTPLEEQGNMLIICYGAFMPDMQDFVNWKRTIGIPTEMVDVASIGANAAAIKTFVADYYANNGLTYLLLVGDNAQIPTVTTGSIGGPSDHAYGYLVGNDHYPDIFVGRFSAETAAQVQTMVNRTITYEQNPDVTNDWFSKGVAIGSDQGPGDDGEYDYQHQRNIRTDLLGFTYTAVSELYDGSQGGEDLPGNPNSTTVANAVNPGSSIINYTGHGSQTSWGTTGFSNSGVNALTNNNMWPFIWSVACVNGDFQNSTCFAEAWLRASNANGPTGAVATLMSTINQSWNPPMEGQDEMNDILVESYAENIKRTFGGISMNGCMKMNDTYGSGGNEMTDTWLIFGDPSLMVRTALPVALNVTHEDVAFIGSSQFVVNCDVENAFACLTMDGEILGTAPVVGGVATIEIPTLNNVGTMKLAVTAFNHLPYITDITILPLEGAYVVFNSVEINDAEGNNNQLLDYNETVALSVGLKNVGTVEVADVMVTISSTDEYVVLGDSTELYPLIGSEETVVITDGFSFSIGSNVPEGHVVRFQYSAVSGDDEWTGSFAIIAHSVILNYAGTEITDEQGNNNGKADPGETFNLNVSVKNEGSSTAYNVTGVLASDDEYVMLNVDSLNFGTINADEILTGAFEVTALPTTPTGHIAEFTLNLSADGGFEATATITIVIGQIPVLIIDLDGNHNSGPAIKTCLSNLSVSSDYVTAWPAALSTYQSVFVCLGVYSNNAVLTNEQGQMLADFMNANGSVYMEGGDTWAYNTATPAHPMFMIDGDTDGASDLSTLNGMEGTLTEGMSFAYTGDNSYIDRLLPLQTATPIFQNSSPSYYSAIAYDGGTYKTIGSSFEFSGLQDASNRSVKDSLMMQYLQFFGINSAAPLLANFVASETLLCPNESVTFSDFSAGSVTSWAWSFPGGIPDTSNEQNPVVTYPEDGTYTVSLTVSDGTNNSTVVKEGYIVVDICEGINNPENRNSLLIYPNPARESFVISANGFNGNSNVRLFNATGVEVYSGVISAEGLTEINVAGLAAGIYMLSVENMNYHKVVKLVVE
ncbi:MAG: C25 family cysteine peptidase [Lentimicrobium sp.]|nr:C25 family cysteine peptidase [Lentimicrobium sp.]